VSFVCSVQSGGADAETQTDLWTVDLWVDENARHSCERRTHLRFRAASETVQNFLALPAPSPFPSAPKFGWTRASRTLVCVHDNEDPVNAYPFSFGRIIVFFRQAGYSYLFDPRMWRS
jgi:hypothetical protein